MAQIRTITFAVVGGIIGCAIGTYVEYQSMIEISGQRMLFCDVGMVSAGKLFLVLGSNLGLITSFILRRVEADAQQTNATVS